jgi:hypothetical protein
MPSSSASICISIKLIPHHHSTRLAHHHNTRLALRHNYQAGSSVLVTSHRLALRHNSGRKQGTHPALRHNHQVGSRVLDLLYVTTIRPEVEVVNLALRRNHRSEDTRLALTHHLALRHTFRSRSKEHIILLYVTTIGQKQGTHHLALRLTTRSEARNTSSCFTSNN